MTHVKNPPSKPIVEMLEKIRRINIPLLKKVKWYQPVLILLIVLSPYLAFHNLETNPRPWQDEGAILSVAKSIAMDGVYASRNVNGYETFGPIQSVGPTVMLPIALVFKWFGVGLLQGRVTIVILSIITTIIFYVVGKRLFGTGASTLALLLLLGCPAVEYLLVSRQVIGENVAFGFFLSGFLLLSVAIMSEKWLYFLLSGLLFGAAIVTKAQFALMFMATFSAIFLLNIFYYHIRLHAKLIGLVFIAILCVAAYYLWQFAYFGAEEMAQNSEKLSQVYQGAWGISLRNSVDAIRFFVGTGSGHFFYFLGLPALLYAGYLSLKRTKDGFLLAFLVVFSGLWIGYYIFWINPWLLTVYVPMAVTALFVGKLWMDVATGFSRSVQNLQWKQFDLRLRQELQPYIFTIVGSMLLMIVLAGSSVYDLQRAIKCYVTDQIGIERTVVRTPPQLDIPHQVAEFLNANVGKGETVETWERELGILTDLAYHYPDQSLLGDTYGAKYRNLPRQHLLGADYFQQVRPAFLVIGWFARSNELYDMQYVDKHAKLIATFGSDVWRYDVFQLASTK